GFPLVELMDGGVGREHRDIEIGKGLKRRRLAGGDGAGQPEPVHQSVAVILARSGSVTSGRTPNQRSNPGTAWCSSMPRPTTVRRPRAAADSSSGVRSGV